MKPEVLKKNIFWILAGVAPFLTFLTFLFVFLFVGGEVSTKSEAITKDLTDLGNKKAKGVKGLATMDKQKDVIAQQKQKLWEANWDQQLKLFTWPASPNNDLKAFEQKYQKFGEKMQVFNDELSTFKTKTIYEGVYDRLAESVKPTLFPNNNWRGVLRHVTDWTEKAPTQNQVWLALEDMWVQKGLLDPVVAVNTAAAVFVPQDDGKDPLKRKFRSRVWDLDLEVPKDGKQAGKIILAKLTNRTDRMQLLGNGKTMNLKVWLSDGGTPILFRIEAAFLKANDVLEVKPVEGLHGIPTGTEVKKLARVEQILDGRTVPIRRIDVVQLGKVDARHAAAALKQPKFILEEVVADAAASSGGLPSGGGGGSTSEGGPPGGMAGMMGGPRGPGGMGGGGLNAAANSGPPAAVLDGNKKRYIDVTDQVRRMPVALVLVVDQMFLQDTLVAFANSSLRFQVTQYHWKRFRGTLSGTADGSGGDGSELSGNPGGQPPGFGGPGGMMPGGMMTPGGMSSSGGMPGFGGGMPGRSGFPGSSGFGPPGGGSETGSTPGGFGGSGAPVSEAQATSGLVELSVYGIITLYEKYDAKVADGTTPPSEPPPAPAPPPPPKPPAAPTNRDPD